VETLHDEQYRFELRLSGCRATANLLGHMRHKRICLAKSTAVAAQPQFAAKACKLVARGIIDWSSIK
jgi:hypothetical protein